MNKMHAMSRTMIRTLCLILLPSSFILLLNGCTLLGVAAYKLKPPETVQPKYMGLENQSTGVMVWADRGLRIDWPLIQLDLANTVQKKLTDFQQGKGREEQHDDEQPPRRPRHGHHPDGWAPEPQPRAARSAGATMPVVDSRSSSAAVQLSQ